MKRYYNAMAAQIRIWFRSMPRPDLFNSSLRPKLQPPRTSQPTMEMVAQPGPTKRPVCPKCHKPARICLCTRLKTPVLQNSVAITILQHKLEKKHPLNSTRIATLGLKNVNVVSVSDVNFESRFVIRPLDPDLGTGPTSLADEVCDFCEIGSNTLHRHEGNADIQGFSKSPEEKNTIFRDYDEQHGKRDDFSFVIEKYGSFKSSLSWISAGQSQRGSLVHGIIPSTWSIDMGFGQGPDHLRRLCQKQGNFDLLVGSALDVESLGKGFTIKKFRRELSNDNVEFEEYDEFEINVPPGSLLLFPSEKSVGIEDIKFDVKNLIVLDGTWAKAKRMYNENPWLRFLPHLKLVLDEQSLYSDVRRQPMDGCLSTIESIVYAMKALGEDSEQLDGLLDVFESMIGYQRRCKNERLTRIAAKPPNS